MKIFGDEKGFFLAEAIVISFILLGMSACMVMYKNAVAMRTDNAARTTAIFLAREQIARVGERAAKNAVSPGSAAWLGDASDLTLNGFRFAVDTDVALYDADFFRVEVTVKFDVRGKRGEEKFERLVKNGG